MIQGDSPWLVLIQCVPSSVNPVPNRVQITTGWPIELAKSRACPGAPRSARRAKMVQLECTALQRLPGGRTTDYDEATVFVTSSSGFVLRTCRRGYRLRTDL